MIESKTTIIDYGALKFIVDHKTSEIRLYLGDNYWIVAKKGQQFPDTLSHFVKDIMDTIESISK